MPEYEKSTVSFRSNLMPRTGHLRDDLGFLRSVSDHGALELLKSANFPLSKEQEQLETCYRKCLYSPPGDYVWGLNQKSGLISCRCLNRQCPKFPACRPDVTAQELALLVENSNPLRRGPTMQRTVIQPADWARLTTTEAADSTLSQSIGDIGSGGGVTLGESASTDGPSAEPSRIGALQPEPAPRFDYPAFSSVFGSSFEDVWGEEPASFWGAANDGWGRFESFDEEEARLERGRQSFRDSIVRADPISQWTAYDEVEGEISLPEYPKLTPDPGEKNARKPRATSNEPEFLSGLFQGFLVASQEEVIKSPASARTVVNAGPGTGKTWSLIERVICMADDLGVEPEDIQILCYSRGAKQVVAERLMEAARRGRLRCGWRRLDIRTIDSYAGAMRYHVGKEEPDWLPKKRKRERKEDSYEGGVREALGIVQKHPEVVAIRHLVVDEIQDVVGGRAQFLLALLSALPEGAGFTLFGDACQAIYDYSLEKGSLTAMGLYERILSDYPGIKCVAFEENRRSTARLRDIAEPFRESILTGTAEHRRTREREIISHLRCGGLPERRDIPAVRSLQQTATTGILTRTNGEALAVSTFLRNQGIDHELELTGHTPGLDAWIARVFDEWGAETMGEKDFERVFSKLWPNADAGPYWEALMSSQRDPYRNRYETRDLLAGLQSTDDARLFRAVGERLSPVQVLTIHKAKGREFDYVRLPSWIFSELVDRVPGDEHEECRVKYVALTRARLDMSVFPALPQLPRILELRKYLSPFARPDEPGRWYDARGPGKLYRLRKMEVGIDRDLFSESFAQTDEAQSHIRDCLEPGMELLIEKEDGPKLRYVLKDPDRPGLKLGDMSHIFCGNVKRLKQPQFIRKKWRMPDGFREVFLRRVVTHVGLAAEAPPAARVRGDYAYWFGLEVCSLARPLFRDY